MGTTTVTEDVALLAVVVGVLAIGALVFQVVRALQPVRPTLPPEDRAPAGLGRLVPVGAQEVEQEVRRGRAGLELWLAAHRRRGAVAAPGGLVVRAQADPRSSRGASARGAG